MNSLFKSKIDIINKNLEKYYGEEIAIYGIGQHTKWMLDNILVDKFKKIYLLDQSASNVGKTKFGFQVHNINDIKDKVKVIIISSQSYEVEIYNRIKDVKQDGIDIMCIYLDINKIIKDKVECKTEGFSINLGAGKWHKRNWKNIDWYSDEIFVDYKLNLLEECGLPFKDNVVSKVFTSHLIEHISDENLENMLHEIHRVMQDNAILRITCPDADLAFEAYKNKEIDFFYSKNGVSLAGDTIERRLVNFFASYEKNDYSGGPIVTDNEVKEKIDSLSKSDFIKWCKNQIPLDAEYIGHINGYYFEKLECMLKEAGFRNIIKSKFRKSSDIELRGEEFDNRPQQSLFVECYK